jgi:hypothetical protein
MLPGIRSLSHSSSVQQRLVSLSLGGDNASELLWTKANREIAVLLTIFNLHEEATDIKDGGSP